MLDIQKVHNMQRVSGGKVANRPPKLALKAARKGIDSANWLVNNLMLRSFWSCNRNPPPKHENSQVTICPKFPVVMSIKNLVRNFHQLVDTKTRVLCTKVLRFQSFTSPRFTRNTRGGGGGGGVVGRVD